MTEGFTFNGTHTGELGLRLIDRSAPTPTKRLIQEDVAFMNGVHDFSRILGEDTYENREISYSFLIPERRYRNRAHAETVIKNRYMQGGIGELDDTHDPNYTYRGQCIDVDVTDDWQSHKLDVTITFDVYPFKIAKLAEGNDIWDTFNFDLDVMQDVSFEVDGTKNITLYNNGIPSVRPKIEVTGNLTITNGTTSVTLNSQTFESDQFRLMPGENDLTLEGNGTVTFTFYKELI